MLHTKKIILRLQKHLLFRFVSSDREREKRMKQPTRTHAHHVQHGKQKTENDCQKVA